MKRKVNMANNKYTNKYWYNKNWITHQWLTLDKSISQICKEFNIPRTGLTSAIRQRNIKKPFDNSPNVTCSYCKKLFYRKPHRVKRAKTNFCSLQCKKLYRKIHRNNDKFYGENWKKLREEALIRDKFKCVRCDRENNLQVHHKIPIKNFKNKEDANYLENLVTYCSRCHKQAEILNYSINFSCKTGVIITHPWLVNIYGGNKTIIKKNSFIGPFVEIQKGVKIGDNTRISSHTFICEGVEIGNNVFVAHGVMFINDRKPVANNKDWKMEKTIIEDGASIGSNATILPVRIGKNALIGAGTVVTKNVPDNAIVVGNPGRVIKYKESK